MSNRGRGSRSKRAGSANSKYSYTVLNGGWRASLRKSLRLSGTKKKGREERLSEDSSAFSSGGGPIEGMEGHNGRNNARNFLEQFRSTLGKRESRKIKRFRPSFVVPAESNNPRYRLEQVSSLEENTDLLETINRSIGSGRGSLKRAPIDTKNKMNKDNHYFSTLLLSREEQRRVCVEMIQSVLDDDTLEKPLAECREAIEEFVDKVQTSYTETAFHNFRHALDVAHMTWLLITHYLHKESNSFNKYERFYMIVIALCHDAKHFGANNKFLNESDELGETEYVAIYGPNSPLENFHIYHAHNILNSCSLFSEEFLPEKEKTELLRLSKELILYTDMDIHDKFITEFIDEVNGENSLFKKLTHKVGVKTHFPRKYLTAVLKIADLANLFRDFEDHLEWSKLISIEYSAMGEKRLEENWEVDDLMKIQEGLDKENFDMIDGAKFTLTFIHQIGIPLSLSFKAVSKAASKTLLELIERNSDEWVKKLQDLGEDVEALTEIGVDVDAFFARHPRLIRQRRRPRSAPPPGNYF